MAESLAELHARTSHKFQPSKPGGKRCANEPSKGYVCQHTENKYMHIGTPAYAKELARIARTSGGAKSRDEELTALRVGGKESAGGKEFKMPPPSKTRVKDATSKRPGVWPKGTTVMVAGYNNPATVLHEFGGEDVGWVRCKTAEGRVIEVKAELLRKPAKDVFKVTAVGMRKIAEVERRAARLMAENSRQEAEYLTKEGNKERAKKFFEQEAKHLAQEKSQTKNFTKSTRRVVQTPTLTRTSAGRRTCTPTAYGAET